MVDKTLTQLPAVTEVSDSDIVYVVQNDAADGKASMQQLRDFLVDGLATQESLTGKQDVLVSGENVKTVNGESILGSGDIIAGGSSQVIRTPVAISPMSGTVDFPVDGTLTGSVYAPLYSADVRDYREFEIDIIDGDFSLPVWKVQGNTDAIQITEDLQDNTDFKWRCRDKSLKGDFSEWSPPQSFKTYDIYVVTPIILSPADGGELPERDQLVVSSEFQIVNSTDTHAASYWTIKNGMGEISYQSGRDATNLTQWQPPPGVIIVGENMTVEVVYESSLGVFSEPGVRNFVGAIAPFDKILAVAHTTAPFISTYGIDVDTFTKMSSPIGAVSGNGRGVAFSGDGVYMAVSHATTPYVSVYKRSGNEFSKLSNPDILPPSVGFGVDVSSDGTYLAVAHNESPFITIYKRSGDVFTKLANPTELPAGVGRKVSFSSDGTYLAVAHDATPFITIYKRSGDVFTKLATPATLPAGAAKGVSFSNDATYLATSHSNSPFITIYKRSGDVFTKLATPATLPPAYCTGAAFSQDGTYLSVGCVSSPYVIIYKRSGDVFTKLANPTVLPSNYVEDVSFSSDGVHLALATYSSPFITIYKRSGDVFTKLPNPSSLPTGDGYGVAFFP